MLADATSLDWSLETNSSHSLDGTGLGLVCWYFLFLLEQGSGQMVSFREQMQRLADSIVKTRNERKAFLQKNQKECTKSRKESTDRRSQTKRELAKQSTDLTKKLSDFNRNNQKSVAKSLRDTCLQRTRNAKASRTAIQQEIAKNRRDVARMLRQNNTDRKRVARQQVRSSTTIIQTVRSQVQRIRTATKRMTRSWSRDRNEARKIWQRLQNGTSRQRDAGRQVTSYASAASLPVHAATVTQSPSIAKSTTLPISDIPLPPSLAPHSIS